jgi:hypothetical protein
MRALPAKIQALQAKTAKVKRRQRSKDGKDRRMAKIKRRQNKRHGKDRVVRKDHKIARKDPKIWRALDLWIFGSLDLCVWSLRQIFAHLSIFA